MGCCLVWVTTKGTTENKILFRVSQLLNLWLSARGGDFSQTGDAGQLSGFYCFIHSLGYSFRSQKMRCNIIQKQNKTANLTLIHNTFSAFNKFLGVKCTFITLQHIYLYILLMGYFIVVCVADTLRVKGEFTQNKIVCHYLPSSRSKPLSCYFSCGKQKSSLRAVERLQKISTQIIWIILSFFLVLILHCLGLFTACQPVVMLLNILILIFFNDLFPTVSNF